MATWGGGGGDQGVGAAPAERALLFISKSLSEVQKGANRDLTLIRQRAKSFRDLANTLDREWEKGVESIKLPLSNVRNSQARITKKIKESGSLTGPSLSAMSPIASQGEQRDFLRNLAPNLPNVRRVQSDPDLRNRLAGEGSSESTGFSGRDLVAKEYPQRRSNAPWAEWSVRRRFHGAEFGQGDWRGLKKRGRKNSDLKFEVWEPLRRAKQSVKESLKELESTAATSKTPSEFFENVRKTEFFENVKKNLKLTSKEASSVGKTFENDVAPLDVPELLESLLRQSGPFLDHMGVKKDVADRVCKVLRSCKRTADPSPTAKCSSEDQDSMAIAKSGADDLNLRIASVVKSTGYKYKAGLFGEQAPAREPGDNARRNIAIVTTASLPWMTGTAINPLFRAAYLAKNGTQNVTLVVPWLCQKDQELVYPDRTTFKSPEEQEAYVRSWVEDRVGFQPDFKIAFYPGKFILAKRSILPIGDVTQAIPDDAADVAVLEEPEHLSWYHHGKSWARKFEQVVGVVHTNYLEYVRRERNGPLQAYLLEGMNNFVCRVQCNKVIRLSGATQMFPNSSVCNVHGVNPQFLRIGEKITAESEEGTAPFNERAYFLGKMVWGKGYKELLDLLNKHKQELKDLKLDVYGNGEDSSAVQSTAKKLGLSMGFHQGRDHADAALHRYKVFINPSISDVVCTTTAEALAMGKIVVCADHPSNEFFRTFPNCYTYTTPDEFVVKVKKAMASEPVPLSSEQRHLLSWDAATDRFLDCAELNQTSTRHNNVDRVSPLPGEAMEEKKTMALSQSMPNVADAVDQGVLFAHFMATGIEAARIVCGAGSGTMHPDSQTCKDLGLPPPSVQRPVYGW